MRWQCAPPDLNIEIYINTLIKPFHTPRSSPTSLKVPSHSWQTSLRRARPPSYHCASHPPTNLIYKPYSKHPIPPGPLPWFLMYKLPSLRPRPVPLSVSPDTRRNAHRRCWVSRCGNFAGGCRKESSRDNGRAVVVGFRAEAQLGEDGPREDHGGSRRVGE